MRCHACDTRTHGRTVESRAVFSLNWIRNIRCLYFSVVIFHLTYVRSSPCLVSRSLRFISVLSGPQSSSSQSWLSTKPGWRPRSKRRWCRCSVAPGPDCLCWLSRPPPSAPPFGDEDVDGNEHDNDDDDDKVGPVDDVDQMLTRGPTHLNSGQLSQARSQLLNTTQPDHPRLSLSLAVIIICHHLPSSRQLFIFSNFCSSSRLFFSLSSWLSAIAHLSRWKGQSSQVLDKVDILCFQQQRPGEAHLHPPNSVLLSSSLSKQGVKKGLQLLGAAQHLPRIYQKTWRETFPIQIRG